jgi:hypothetical protein
MFGGRNFQLNTKSFVIIAGAVILFLKLFSSIIEGSYDNLFIQKQKDEDKFQDPLTRNIQSSTFRSFWWYQVFININAFNLQVLLLAVCASLGVPHLFLLYFSIYYFARLIIVLVFYFQRAKSRLA